MPSGHAGDCMDTKKYERKTKKMNLHSINTRLTIKLIINVNSEMTVACLSLKEY